VLGQQLARPLLLLAEGVGEVARGDLRPKAIFASKDELGGLTRSFAAMTQQLADARMLADRSVQDLDSARAHLQTVLDNLTAGVIVFDSLGRIDIVNPGATRILRLPLSAYRGRPLSDVPELEDAGRAPAMARVLRVATARQPRALDTAGARCRTAARRAPDRLR